MIFQGAFIQHACFIPNQDSCLRRNGLPRILCGDGNSVLIYLMDVWRLPVRINMWWLHGGLHSHDVSNGNYSCTSFLRMQESGHAK